MHEVQELQQPVKEMTQQIKEMQQQQFSPTISPLRPLSRTSVSQAVPVPPIRQAQTRHIQLPPAFHPPSIHPPSVLQAPLTPLQPALHRQLSLDQRLDGKS